MSTLKRIVGLIAILGAVIVACGAAADLRTMHASAAGLPQGDASTETPTDTPLPTATLTVAPLPSDTAPITPPPADTLTATPNPTDTPTATPAPTDTPTDTPLPTDTLGPPLLSVSAATNCRTGPSVNYSVVYILRPGITVLVVGKDLPDNYWIIAVPGYPGTVCWLWGQYAMVTGDTGSIPPPATPQPSYYTLGEPKNLSASCSSQPNNDDASTWTVTLSWMNTEPRQTGVRIYRYGAQIATLHGFPRTFTNKFIHYDFHSGVRYGIQAYNASGYSSIVWISFHSCHD